jgi:hypothetical protein
MISGGFRQNLDALLNLAMLDTQTDLTFCVRRGLASTKKGMDIAGSLAGDGEPGGNQCISMEIDWGLMREGA